MVIQQIELATKVNSMSIKFLKQRVDAGEENRLMSLTLSKQWY